MQRSLESGSDLDHARASKGFGGKHFWREFRGCAVFFGPAFWTMVAMNRTSDRSLPLCYYVSLHWAFLFEYSSYSTVNILSSHCLLYIAQCFDPTLVWRKHPRAHPQWKLTTLTRLLLLGCAMTSFSCRGWRNIDRKGMYSTRCLSSLFSFFHVLASSIYING